VEYEQDRGLKIVSVSNRLGSLYAFLRYLIEHDLADAQLLARKIKLKVPDALPRAIEPEDVKCLLAVLDDVRNRAMILLLLRTGMRIGELLNTKLVDVYLADKKIMIYEGEKNRKGRAVCFSNDAGQALIWVYLSAQYEKTKELTKSTLFPIGALCLIRVKPADPNNTCISILR